MLLFALFGTVLATHPTVSDRGITQVVTLNQNITTDGEGGSDKAACDEDDSISINVAGFDAEGEASATTVNGVTVNVTYDATTKEVSFTTEDGVVLIAYVKGGNDYATYNYTGLGGVESDGNLYAPHNASGGPAGLSHVVFCTGEGPDATPTFFQSQEGETDAPTGTPIITAPPTVGPTPTFFQTQGGQTDAPSEPDTTTITTGGPASPADSAWLLVVALGVLLASVVVLTPARAKSRR
jgi:hypothetical protein